MTDLGIYYSEISGKNDEIVINRFFGIFFAFYRTSNSVFNESLSKAFIETSYIGNIWGNVISSTVLKPEIEENSTFTINYSLCGVNDCGGSGSAEIKKPIMSTVRTLLLF